MLQPKSLQISLLQILSFLKFKNSKHLVSSCQNILKGIIARTVIA